MSDINQRSTLPSDSQFSSSSTLQRYNQELSKHIENIKENREDLHEEIQRDEEERQLLEQEILSLSERLSALNEGLAKKYEAQEEFDRTIGESEEAFLRILESSQTLVQVLKKEDKQLMKKKGQVSSRRGTMKLDELSMQQSAEKKKTGGILTYKKQEKRQFIESIQEQTDQSQVQDEEQNN